MTPTTLPTARPPTMGVSVALSLVFAALLPGCQAGADGPGPGADTRPYDGIAPGEAISMIGTEPFWGGTIEGGRMTYSTLDDQDGTSFPVARFTGNNGVSFSGTLKGRAVDVAITPGTCSDGMTDRTFPFVATLAIGGETRNGCAYTDRQPFSGPRNP